MGAFLREFFAFRVSVEVLKGQRGRDQSQDERALYNCLAASQESQAVLPEASWRGRGGFGLQRPREGEGKEGRGAGRGSRGGSE